MNIKDEVRAILAKGSRDDIADKLGVTKPALAQWATGEGLITEPHLAKLVELENLDDRAKEAELLRLYLLLWQERLRRDDKEKPRWTTSALDLANRTLELAHSLMAKPRLPKSSARTLCDFPNSFYPLAIVSGDKREDSESRITAGDFGAVSASHAELRWLCELGLREDVELYGDKVFVLESTEELKARFGKKHLLVVGSPGSNHLARRCLLVPPRPGWHPATAIFRFNLSQYTLHEKIEKFLESLQGMRTKQLVGKRADEAIERDMKNWLHYLFTGGILDPTHTDHWARGLDIPANRDYALITLARNPFSEDRSYMCIMVAGFHLLGTAHALRMLAKPDNFVRHPLGGVIKIAIDTGLPFAKRFDDSTGEWDDKVGYTVEDLRDRLKKMQADLAPTLNISHEEIDECLTFLMSL